MSIERWKARQEPTKQEQSLLKRLDRVRKLFRFLREQRHELFDDALQVELEGTVNLLAHAARKVVTCAAALLGWDPDQVCRKAGIPLLLESSVKNGLDLQWSDQEQKRQAAEILAKQLIASENWP